MGENRLRPNVFAGATLALSAGFLVACAEPLTPEIVGRMDGRKFAAENGFCPPRWRDEHGVISQEEMNRVYSQGAYDDPESFEIWDRYRREYDDACASQLLNPRSDV